MQKAVLIADDNALVRTTLYKLFEAEPDFEVCAVAENGREAIEEARRLHPDLIVLDLAMPVMNGLDAARVLKRIMPQVPLIMFSAMEGISEKLAKAVGIAAIISKGNPVSLLIARARSLVCRQAA